MRSAGTEWSSVNITLWVSAWAEQPYPTGPSRSNTTDYQCLYHCIVLGYVSIARSRCPHGTLHRSIRATVDTCTFTEDSLHIHTARQPVTSTTGTGHHHHLSHLIHQSPKTTTNIDGNRTHDKNLLQNYTKLHCTIEPNHWNKWSSNMYTT